MRTLATADLRHIRPAPYHLRHPEWWVGIAVLAGWGFVAYQHGDHFFPNLAFAPAPHDLQHAHHHSAAATTTGWSSGIGQWTAMSVAMMLPVTWPGLGYVVLNSLRIRRRRSLAIFVVVFVIVWILLGAAVLLAIRTLPRITGANERTIAVTAILGAAVWQISPWKRRSLFACRRVVPLRPVGRRADLSVVKYASVCGWRCERSCAPMMVAMATLNHVGLLAMVGASAYMVAESRSVRVARLVRGSALALGLLAMIVIVT